MSQRAAITVLRSREETQRLWQSAEYRSSYIGGADVVVSFRDAPGDRGTQIHVDLGQQRAGGRLGALAGKLSGAPALAKVKDDLRRFKQQAETGVVPRSEGAPEGELAERKLKQRPAQPLDESELEKAGA